MPATAYRIWSEGPEVRKKDSKTIQYHIGVHAIAKRSLITKYETANEFICLNLGRAINLPIPAGVPLTLFDDLFFSSMVFGGSGHGLPPCDVEELIRYDPNTACGIVLFDCWICNPDRNELNISFHTETNEIKIFDHGQALLGDGGSSTLGACKGAIIVGRDTHCLATDIKTLASFDVWEERILAVPEYLIREVARDAIDLGVGEALANECADFLIERRKKLRTMFSIAQDDKDIFPNLSSSLFKVKSWEELEQIKRAAKENDHIEYHI